MIAALLLLIPAAVVYAILADVRQHDRWDAEDAAAEIPWWDAP